MASERRGELYKVLLDNGIQKWLEPLKMEYVIRKQWR